MFLLLFIRRLKSHHGVLLVRRLCDVHVIGFVLGLCLTMEVGKELRPKKANSVSGRTIFQHSIGLHDDALLVIRSQGRMPQKYVCSNFFEADALFLSHHFFETGIMPCEIAVIGFVPLLHGCCSSGRTRPSMGKVFSRRPLPQASSHSHPGPFLQQQNLESAPKAVAWPGGIPSFGLVRLPLPSEQLLGPWLNHTMEVKCLSPKTFLSPPI